MIAAGLVQNGANVWIFSRTPDDAVAAQLTERGPGTCTSLRYQRQGGDRRGCGGGE